MTMMRKLFRPGAGSKVARYTAAFVNGTVYGGDVVTWDKTAPASQGPTAGTLEGKSLGTDDFVYVKANAATDAPCLQAGIVRGKTIDFDGVNAITDDNIAIIQTWGICENCRTADATVAAGAVMILDATAGELADAAAATDYANDGDAVAVALTADYTYTRGTVATETGVTAFVRCDW